LRDVCDSKFVKLSREGVQDKGFRRDSNVVEASRGTRLVLDNFISAIVSFMIHETLFGGPSSFSLIR